MSQTTTETANPSLSPDQAKVNELNAELGKAKTETNRLKAELLEYQAKLNTVTGAERKKMLIALKKLLLEAGQPYDDLTYESPLHQLVALYEEHILTEREKKMNEVSAQKALIQNYQDGLMNNGWERGKLQKELTEEVKIDGVKTRVFKDDLAARTGGRWRHFVFMICVGLAGVIFILFVAALSPTPNNAAGEAKKDLSKHALPKGEK